MGRNYIIHEVEAEMFNCNKNYPNTIAFRINWVSNIGFGELSFYYNIIEKKWYYDSECMGEEFCSAVLKKWLNDVMEEKDNE